MFWRSKGAKSIWTGNRMIVWGGWTFTAGAQNSGRRCAIGHASDEARI